MKNTVSSFRKIALAAWLTAAAVDDLSVFDEIWFTGTADVTATTSTSCRATTVTTASAKFDLCGNSITVPNIVGPLQKNRKSLNYGHG